jgi:hypothetical protein
MTREGLLIRWQLADIIRPIGSHFWMMAVVAVSICYLNQRSNLPTWALNPTRASQELKSSTGIRNLYK